MSLNTPEVSAAVALAQTLQAQSAALSFKELSQKLTTTRQTLARFDAHRAELREAHAQAVAARRKREATLLLEQSDLAPERDSEYCELRDREQATRERLLSLGDEEEKLRQLARTLNAELQARESRLRQLVQAASWDSWKGKASERVTAARLALAEALIAYCADRTTSPLAADSGLFFQNMVGSGDVNTLVKRIIEAEQKRLRDEIVQRDGMLG